jgi:hypothetical protein
MGAEREAVLPTHEPHLAGKLEHIGRRSTHNWGAKSDQVILAQFQRTYLPDLENIALSGGLLDTGRYCVADLLGVTGLRKVDDYALHAATFFRPVPRYAFYLGPAVAARWTSSDILSPR